MCYFDTPIRKYQEPPQILATVKLSHGDLLWPMGKFTSGRSWWTFPS